MKANQNCRLQTFWVYSVMKETWERITAWPIKMLITQIIENLTEESHEQLDAKGIVYNFCLDEIIGHKLEVFLEDFPHARIRTFHILTDNEYQNLRSGNLKYEAKFTN